jgi:hypothetical protein
MSRSSSKSMRRRKESGRRRSGIAKLKYSRIERRSQKRNL